MEFTSLYLMIAGVAPLLAASPYCRSSTHPMEIHCFHFAGDVNFFDCYSNFSYSLPQRPRYVVLNDIETFFAFQVPPKTPMPNPTRILFGKKVRVYDDSTPEAKDYFVEVSARSMNAGQIHRLRISAPPDSQFKMISIEVDVPDRGSVIFKSLTLQPNGRVPTLFIFAQSLPH
jgi:hypothetical protein